MTATTGVFAPKVNEAPIYDGLIVQQGFDPEAMVTIPTAKSVWPTLPRRARHRIAKATQKVWDEA